MNELEVLSEPYEIVDYLGTQDLNIAAGYNHCSCILKDSSTKTKEFAMTSDKTARSIMVLPHEILLRVVDQVIHQRNDGAEQSWNLKGLKGSGRNARYASSYACDAVTDDREP